MISEEDSEYPWFLRLSSGDIDFCGIPERLLRNPELQHRGIVPTDVLKPGTVFRTLFGIDPVYVVKILDPSTEELAIYQRLLHEPKRPNNHIVPFEIILEDHPLLIMPSFGNPECVHQWKVTPYIIVDILFQLVEGLSFLHNLHIVHMDICPENLIAANRHHASVYKTAVENSLYIIDFDSSRQFKLGPGVQRAITLPETQTQPPNGLKHLDPYSWDVYCTGCTLELIINGRHWRAKTEPHPLIQSYIRWLIGNEQGCTGVCRCRPTACMALRMVLVIRWAFSAPEEYAWVVKSLSHALPT